MAKRKEIRRVKKNPYGNPIVHIRAFFPPLRLQEQTYTEAHIYSTLDGFEMTLRGEDSEPASAMSLWENFSWPAPSTEYGLLERLDGVIDGFRSGLVPPNLRFKIDPYLQVLV